MLAILVCLGLAAQAGGLVLEGRVVDVDGAAVVGAAVGVACKGEVPLDPPQLLADTISDGLGGFRIDLPAEWLRRAGSRDLGLLAHAPGYGLATWHFEVADMPLGLELELVLPRPPGERVRIVDAAGEPVRDAEVTLLAIHHPPAAQVDVPAGWAEPRATRTDAEGWAELLAPLERVRRVAVRAPGHERHEVFADRFVDPYLPRTLALLETAELRVSWGGGEPPAGSVRITIAQGGSEEIPYRVECTLEPTLQGPGPLVLTAPSGQERAQLRSDDASALLWSTERAAADASDVALARAAHYTVRGRVVDARSGAGVGGARLRLASLVGRGWVVSGPDGTFRFEAGKGVGSVQAVLAPAGRRSLTAVDGVHFRPPEGSRDEVQLPDIALESTGRIHGTVLDATGEPRAEAWVLGRAKVPAGRLTADLCLTAVSDGAGRFVLEDAPLGRRFELLARHAGALGRGRARAGETVELQLGPPLAARGRLVDETGVPVVGARVEVWRASQYIAMERREVLGCRDHVRSDATGAFETPAGLDPELRYALRISDGSVEPHAGEWLDAATLSAGVELVLRRRGTLRGTLRGPDGEPLANVRVRLRRGLASARTDAQGRFVLDELPQMGDVLVAEVPGEAPRARWARAGEELDWRLQARGEAPLLAPAPPADREQELLLALELLEQRYAEAAASGTEGQRLSAVQELARADPALALERVEAGLLTTSWMHAHALAAVTDALRETSPAEALAVSRRIPRGMAASLATLRAAEGLGRDAEEEQLALARAEARGVDTPEHRLVVLAHLADRLLDLGQDAAAAGVLEEGRALAAHLPIADWASYARGRFAEVLSRADSEAARALIDELADAAERRRHLGNGALKLAATDPARAEAWLREIAARPEHAYEAQRRAPGVVYAMAPVDLERARAVAERHDRTGFSDGMIALALVEAAGGLDRSTREAQALASLEQAFRRAEDVRPPLTTTHEPTTDPATVAAALLAVAERVDPAGLETWVARVLALPRPRPGGGFVGDTSAWLSDATLAYYLARWDRELARGLLEPALAGLEPRAGTRTSMDRGDDVLWAALAVTDPERAARIARELRGRARTRVAQVLALPPEQRTRHVQEHLLHLWVVGKDHF